MTLSARTPARTARPPRFVVLASAGRRGSRVDIWTAYPAPSAPRQRRFVAAARRIVA